MITIKFDGGCRPTNPGNKYGSYDISINGAPLMRQDRIELGWGTSNEAEFESLIAGLEALRKRVDEFGGAPGIEVQIWTDSTIVANRMNGRNKRCGTEPEQRMSRLTQRAMGLLDGFRSVKVRWHRRDENVKLFGH